MKKAVVFLFLCLPLILSGQPRVTLKSQLDSLEAAFDVHFVYEASLPLDIPALIDDNPGDISFFLAGAYPAGNFPGLFDCLLNRIHRILPVMQDALRKPV